MSKLNCDSRCRKCNCLLIDCPQIISIIGTNGAGKSTVLKTFARLLKPKKGKVLLDGREIQNAPGKEIARIMAVLPQSTSAPMDILVKDLVACGRNPYQGHFSSLAQEDHEIIRRAMVETGVLEFAHRPLAGPGDERQASMACNGFGSGTGDPALG